MVLFEKKELTEELSDYALKMTRVCVRSMSDDRIIQRLSRDIPQKTVNARLQEAWRYPALVEKYEARKDVVSASPFVLVGALEMSYAHLDGQYPGVSFTIDHCLGELYPCFLKRRNTSCFYLPLTMNIPRGGLLVLSGSGSFAERTVASVSLRVIRALTLHRAAPQIYLVSDSLNDSVGMAMQMYLSMKNVYRISSSEATKQVRQRGKARIPEVYITAKTLRDPALRLAAEDKFSTDSRYVIGCWEALAAQNLYTLTDGKRWMREVQSEKDGISLKSEFFPFRLPIADM
ncbi:MAG: hypothetical protein IJ083_05360 [Clostridia bacterium]|nr:hypothetical protein [Clostridia bacterium]